MLRIVYGTKLGIAFTVCRLSKFLKLKVDHYKVLNCDEYLLYRIFKFNFIIDVSDNIYV